MPSTLQRFLLLLLSGFLQADDSCRSECHQDRMPQCGVWLMKETNPAVAGTYELHHGLVNMSCEFSSLPEPATVTWLHKAPNSISWTDFVCSNKDETKQCRETEHRVTSRCLLRTNSLTMTGNYRCQATTSEQKSKAISSEIGINVVGIEKISMVNYHLPFGKIGHVEVEICANPKPEIFWLVPDAIIQPHTVGNSHISATHLHPKKIRQHRDGPAVVVPYCYTSRLLVRNVTASDEFQLLVKSETESRTVDLNVKIANIPDTAAYPRLVLTLLVLLLTQL
ncbi:unnamed protein product [Nippostrongylus brasiliensis]|uniref:Ig-like domain-containing protein n=1 Tax=Nippostrongylus brasiliensis TaxID=27835 RepID=A0A0N4XGD7_NIPBR|nr:unnamed protein product [Nippostrongylus brasiliensis]